MPGLPEVRVDPEVVFLVFLPPLLASAGFYSSPRELRAELRPLTFLAVGLVLATMGGVAVAAHALIDGLSWPAAFVLGAVVAPTDPVAATATFSRMHVPERVGLLVEGEAMVNDATALVAFRVALAAAIAGSFSVADAALDFVVSAVAGVAIGLAAGWIEVHVLRKLDDRPLSILLSLLFPYAAYVAAEEAHVSGVLAAVVCGLYLGWFAHETFNADTRLSASAFWEVLVFGLNALLFLLLGLQFPAIVDDARAGDSFGTLLLTALALAAVVVLIRLVGVFLPLTRTGDGWRERLVIAWSGMRGAISLAAALSVPVDRRRPAGHPVRDGRGDPRDARRPGPHAPRAAALPGAEGRAPVVARRGDRPAGDRAVRARPARRARGRGRGGRGAAAPHARALPRALPRLPGRARRRRAGRRRRRPRDPPALRGPAPRADRRRARRAARACATRTSCAPTSSA